MENAKNEKKQIFFLEDDLKLFDSIQFELIEEQKKKSISVIVYTALPFPKVYDFFSTGKQGVINLRICLVDDFFVKILQRKGFVFGIGEVPNTKPELEEILSITTN